MDPAFVVKQLLEAYGGLPRTMSGLEQMLLDAYLLGVAHGKEDARGDHETSL